MNKLIVLILLFTLSICAQTFNFSGIKTYDAKTQAIIGAYDSPGKLIMSNGSMKLAFDGGTTEYYSLFNPKAGTEALNQSVKQKIRNWFNVTGEIIIYHDLSSTGQLKHWIIIANQRCWIMRMPQAGDTLGVIAEILLK